VISLLIGVVGGLIFGAIAIIVTGADTDNPSTFSITLFSTVAYAWIVVTFWFFALHRRRVGPRELFKKKLSWGTLALLLPTAVGVFLLSGALIQLVVNLTGVDAPDQSLLGEGETINGYNWLLLIWTACVCAPLAEEFVFRGIIYGFFRKRWNWFLAALIPSALFAVSHVTPYVWVAFFVLGMVLALVREWTKTLLGPIIIHALYNGLVLLGLYALTGVGN
jgi:membrane protease YdiL (CAAX protease family)